jgi:tetratricopeptide (TPR) repeat protein
MVVWSAEIKEIEKLYKSFGGQLPEIEKELGQLVKTDDRNVILLYARRCLEVIISDLCKYELKRERGTEPLKGIIDKLNKERKVPSHIITSMHGLNDLSTYGTHPKDFDPEQVKPVLVNLDIIIKWYLKFKQIVTIGRTEIEEEKTRLKEKPLEEVLKETRIEELEKPVRLTKHKFLSGVLISTILVIAVILAYPKIFKQNTLERLRSKGERIAVAVMPFQNMTNDTTWNVWQDGIQDILITNLSNSEDFKVRQYESVNTLIQNHNLTNYTSITPSLANTISKKLEANLFILGKIIRSGSVVRLNAQLFNSKTEEVYKSFHVEGTFDEKRILPLVDSLSILIMNTLSIASLQEKLRPDQHRLSSKSSPEAYRYFILGNNARLELDAETAGEMYSRAIKIDSNFTYAYIKLINIIRGMGLLDSAKRTCLRIYRRRDQMPTQLMLLTSWIYSGLFKEKSEDGYKYLLQLNEIDDQLPNVHFNLGSAYYSRNQFDKAVFEYEKYLEILDKWGTKPEWIFYYIQIGDAYHKTGQYKNEKKIYKRAFHDFPNYNYFLVRNQVLVALKDRQTKKTNEYIEKYKSICKDESMSEAETTRCLAEIYAEAGLLDKAEEYFRQALSFEPTDPDYLNILSYF